MPEEENGKKPDSSIELKLRDVKDVAIVDIEGRIDLSASELIELTGWLLKRGKRKILFNFEHVDTLDYSGLSVLAIAYKNVRNHEGVLKFVAVPLHIQKLFRIAQLLDVFELHQEEGIALSSFNETRFEPLPPLRRRFKRLEVVNITVRFLPVYRKEDPFFEGKATNLGGEGLFLYASKIFPLNTDLILELHFPKESSPFTIQGTVIWLADKELQPHDFPGMGVRFKKLDLKQQKQLIEFIDRNVVQRSG